MLSKEKCISSFAEGVATVRLDIRQKLILAIRYNKPSEWIRELIELGKFTDQELREIYTEAKNSYTQCSIFAKSP
jgi:hypothetical protein